jgi:hypothetical protein
MARNCKCPDQREGCHESHHHYASLYKVQKPKPLIENKKKRTTARVTDFIELENGIIPKSVEIVPFSKIAVINE